MSADPRARVKRKIKARKDPSLNRSIEVVRNRRPAVTKVVKEDAVQVNGAPLRLTQGNAETDHSF